MVSAGAVAGGAILDRSFRFPADVSQYLELPVLATIPDTTPQPPGRWQRWKAKRQSRRAQKEAQKSKAAEFNWQKPRRSSHTRLWKKNRGSRKAQAMKTTKEERS
jgi:hypothetical protein